MRATLAFLLLLFVAGIVTTDRASGPVPAQPGHGPAAGSQAPSLSNPPVLAPAAPVAALIPRTPLKEGQDSRIPTPQLAAVLPKTTAAQLPATLELVTFPETPGAPVLVPKTISRTDAVASVMASPEFQETVTPLARLYFATFGRYPDYDGLNYYTGQREEARALDAIATEFAGSREFELRYGLLDNAEFVARILANVLGHQSQADVRAHWTAELDAGRMTRGQVIVDLAESGAFRERVANQVFVSTAYTEILQRTPDPAGFSFWVAQMQSGQSAKTVIDGLLAGR